MKKQKFLSVEFLGTGVSYAGGMSRMREAIQAAQQATPAEYQPRLLLLEHADTITVTRQTPVAHLLRSPQQLHALGIDLVETDRGGDVTYHGPGQLVAYPIIKLPPLKEPNLENPAWQVDLSRYIRMLEKALFNACIELGVTGCHLIPGLTGIWVSSAMDQPEKLVAIGVGVSQGVTKHGFALNVTTDIRKMTESIVPCGLYGKGVTSLEIELRKRAKEMPDMATITQTVVDAFCETFSFVPQTDLDGVSDGRKNYHATIG